MATARATAASACVRDSIHRLSVPISTAAAVTSVASSSTCTTAQSMRHASSTAAAQPNGPATAAGETAKLPPRKKASPADIATVLVKEDIKRLATLQAKRTGKAVPAPDANDMPLRLFLQQDSNDSESAADATLRGAAAQAGDGPDDAEDSDEAVSDDADEDDIVDEDDGFDAEDVDDASGSWHENPYADVVRTYYKRSINPPSTIAKAVDGVLKGRNIAALNSHWSDMMQSLKERNVSLMNSSKQREVLRDAHKAGQLAEVPHNAANTNSPPLLYGPNETLSHVLHAVYPSYGVINRILGEIQEQLPNWEPKSMLDFGCGPGTAVLTGTELWPDSLFDVVVVEPSRSMTQVAEHMLADTAGVMYRRSLDEVRRFHRGKKFDLIVAHYTLAQLPTDKEREDAITQLWDLLSPGGVIVLSEHGDRWGFNVIRTARDQLLQRASALAAFMPQLMADRALGPGSAGSGSGRLGADGRPRLGPGFGGSSEDGSNDEDDDSAFEFDSEEEEGEEDDEDYDPIAARKGKRMEELQRAYEQQSSRSAAIKAGTAAPVTSRDLASLDAIDHNEGPGAINKAAAAATSASLAAASAGLASSSSGKRAPYDALLPVVSSKDYLYDSSKPVVPFASDVKGFLKSYAKAHEDSLAGHRMLRAPAEPQLGAAVVGPCPHAHACPMPGNSWCHFSQAVARHRKAGRSVHTRSLPSRVERFSYVMIRKTDGTTELEHPPFARAGWKATSGAFSFDESSIVNSNNNDDGDDRDGERKGKGAQISAFSAGLGGKTDGSRVLQMTRRGLEPDRWWLDNRPGRLEREDTDEDESSGRVRSRRGRRVSLEDSSDDEAGGMGRGGSRTRPTTAELIRATGLSGGRAGDQAFSKKSKVKAAFGSAGEGPALYNILDRERGVGSSDADDDQDDGATAGRASGRTGKGVNPDYHEHLGGGDDIDDEELQRHRTEALEDAVEDAVAAGLPGAGQWSRLVRPPLKRSGHVILDVCTPQGTFERRVASKGKLKDYYGAYRAARRATWGGQWPNWLSRRRDSNPGFNWSQAIAAGANAGNKQLGGGQQLLEEGQRKLEAGAGADAERTRPPRDRSNQQRPSRRARRRAALALATDTSNLVTDKEKEIAGFAMSGAGAGAGSGILGSAGGLTGGRGAGLGGGMGMGGGQGGLFGRQGTGIDLNDSGAGAIDVEPETAALLDRIRSGAAKLATATGGPRVAGRTERGVPRNAQEAAIASNFADGRVHGIDASAALSKKRGGSQPGPATGKAGSRRSG